MGINTVNSLLFSSEKRKTSQWQFEMLWFRPARTSPEDKRGKGFVSVGVSIIPRQSSHFFSFKSPHVSLQIPFWNSTVWSFVLIQTPKFPNSKMFFSLVKCESPALFAIASLQRNAETRNRISTLGVDIGRLEIAVHFFKINVCERKICAAITNRNFNIF
ncbi:MAG: hypothetical protein ACI9BD_001183 [Candidatus Marinamargulisbacteria bacterium]|jgi:hypothetical protein